MSSRGKKVRARRLAREAMYDDPVYVVGPNMYRNLMRWCREQYFIHREYRWIHKT